MSKKWCQHVLADKGSIINSRDGIFWASIATLSFSLASHPASLSPSSPLAVMGVGYSVLNDGRSTQGANVVVIIIPVSIFLPDSRPARMLPNCSNPKAASKAFDRSKSPMADSFCPIIALIAVNRSFELAERSSCSGLAQAKSKDRSTVTEGAPWLVIASSPTTPSILCLARFGLGSFSLDLEKRRRS